MSRYQKTKRAGSTLDYVFDWTDEDWLDTGELIVTSVWTEPTGITVLTTSNTDTTTTIWILGGTAGETYKFSNTITTDNSPARIDSRELILKVL